jgi:predicted O-methyltransferase YrrM
VLLVAPISSRNQFGDLLTERGLTGHAVEVGTHRGEFAATLLSTWSGKLYCVDPWDNLPEYIEQAKFLDGGGQDREADYEIVKELVAPYSDRVLLMRCTSEVAFRTFEDNSLDFVYIDGNHDADYVNLDLRTWWPKLRQGGLLAGHDIVCPGPAAIDNWGKSIQPAVFRFAQQQKVDVYLVVEESGLPWSYYLVKP